MRPIGFVKNNGAGEIIFRQAGHPSNDPEQPWRPVFGRRDATGWEMRDALVGDRQRLYQTSATFKASITVLAQLLPLMVDGIAADAERNEVAMAERIDALEREPLRMPEEIRSEFRYHPRHVDWPQP